MALGATAPGFEHGHVVNTFDWSTMDEGTVVDIGGSHGSLCIEIAQRVPRIHCIVQDLPDVVKSGQTSLPTTIGNSVTFMAHDFFDEQPVKNADVYILRQILHDWSDKYAIRILRALRPSLKAGAKILIIEQILPEPNTVSKYQEKLLR